MQYVCLIITTIIFCKAVAMQKQLRIIGGRKAEIEQFPFQVSIILKKTVGFQITSFKGAAVIVSHQWALTAAHCIAFEDASLFKGGFMHLRGNVSDWEMEKSYQDHLIILTELHPKYKTYAMDYNIALVKVKEPFNGAQEKPISVAGKYYQVKDNQAVTVSGWGKTETEGKEPVSQLRSVQMRVINQEICSNIYADGFKPKITSRMLCAKWHGRDICLYDSGGPLVANKVLVGIVNWGRTCGDDVYPGVYIKVSEFYDWIREYESTNDVSLGIKFAKNKA